MSVGDAAAKTELVALVVWLQTFPGFTLNSRKPVTCDTVMDLLSTSSVARYVFCRPLKTKRHCISSLTLRLFGYREIWKVAESVCGEQDELSSPKADDVWTRLLALVSTRARPLLSGQDDDKSLSPPRLKSYVLSCLLDCAVQTTGLDLRKQYISRIMELPKPTQKTLMGMIEQRTGAKSKSTSGTPSKSSMKKSSSRSSASSATPGSTSRLAHSTAKIYGSAPRSTPPPPPPPPPLPSSSKDTTARHGSGTRRSSTSNNETPAKDSSRTVLIGTPYSTPPRRPTSSTNLDSAATTVAADTQVGGANFLSPATMESPQKLQNIVTELRQRNEQLQSVLDKYQERHDHMQNKVTQLEIQHRQHMLKHETDSLERLQDTKDEYTQKLAQLQSDLALAQQEADENKAAATELREAKDQLEEHQHQSKLLFETMEKLRRYKAKLEDFQDMQNQLKREQEAHARCIEDICRLEAQVATLEPIRRQVDDYKNRAIQAEVKLTESQEYLQRLEKANKEQSLTNEYLWKGAIIQKEHLEELQERIQQEVCSSSNKLVASTAERINPELQVELARLRSENVQLRSFAAKRQDDAVTNLEQELDDSKRMGEAYKKQFLTTKNTLALVNVELANTQQCLQVTTEELTTRSEDAEAKSRSLQSKVDQLTTDLDKSREQVLQAKENIRELEMQVQEYKAKYMEADNRASENQDNWKRAQKEVDDTNTELDTLSQQCQRLIRDLDDQKNRNKQLEEMQGRLGKDLQAANVELEDSHMKITELSRIKKDSDTRLKNLMEAKLKLQEQLDEETQQHQATRSESQRSLDATRAILLSQSKKEVNEVQDNMNRLLEDERRANRRKDDEYKREIAVINSKWNKKYQELEEQNVHLSREKLLAEQDSQQKIDYMKQEHQAEIEKLRQDVKSDRTNLIHQGQGVIENLKLELQQTKKDLQETNDLRKAAESARDEIEKLLRGKINSLKDKLEISAEETSDLIREKADLDHKWRAMEREHRKLLDDNDRFRRQLSGGFGDGHSQAQLERLQRECNDLLQENRSLKQNGFSAIIDDDAELSSYGRSRSTIAQVRREYEEKIEALTDEKRELVMKQSASFADVQKAEQRAWEREQENARLANELTSVRVELARYQQQRDGPENKSQNPEVSFMTAMEDEFTRSPLPGSIAAGSLSTHSRLGMGSFDNLEMPRSRSRSPSLSRAMQNRADHETALRHRISTLTGTPPRAPARAGNLPPSSYNVPTLDTNSPGLHSQSSEKVLSPTTRHDNVFNTRQDRFGGQYSSDPNRRHSASSDTSSYAKPSSSDTFGFRRSSPPASSMRASYDKIPSLMDDFEDHQSGRTEWR